MVNIKLYFIFSFKEMINKLKFYPLKSLSLSMVMAGVVFFPVFIFRNQVSIDIDLKYLSAFFSLYMANFFYKLYKSPNDKAFSNKLKILMTLVACRSKVMYKLFIFDKAVRTFSYYSLMYLIIYVYNSGLLSNYFVGLLLVLCMSCMNALLETIVFYNGKLTTRRFSYFYVVISVFFILYASLIMLNVLLAESMMFTPNNILANSVKILLDSSSSLNLRLLSVNLASLIVMISIALLVSISLERKVSFKISDIYAVSSNNKSRLSTVRFQRLCRLAWFLPARVRVITCKELIQIWDEKTPLITAIVMPLFAMGIMIFAAKSLSNNIYTLGYIIVVSYLSFLVALVSIPREMSSLWILKTMRVSPMTILIGKLLAMSVVCIAFNLCVILVYGGIGYFVIRQSPLLLLKPFVWTTILTVPLSIAYGLIASSFLPFKIIRKNKAVDYKYGGLESGMLFLLVFVVALPSTIAGGFFDGLNSMYLTVLYGMYHVIILSVAAYRFNKTIYS